MEKYRWPAVHWSGGRGEYDFTGSFEEIRDTLPSKPGVYFWMVYRHSNDPPSRKYVYVGETVNLHRGLRKFFSTGDTHRTVSAHTKCCRFFKDKQAHGFKVRLRLLELEQIECEGRAYSEEHLLSTEHRQFIKGLLTQRAAAKGFQLLYTDVPTELQPLDPVIKVEDIESLPTYEEDKRPRRIYIYALLDPITDRVYYVGQSQRPRSRYRRHIASRSPDNLAVFNWVHYLNQAYSKRPKLAIIDRVPPFAEPRRCEVWWICKFIELGHPLLNLKDSRWNEAEWGTWSEATLMKGSYEKASDRCNTFVYAALKGARVPEYR